MGDWTIVPTRPETTINIAVTGDFEPGAAIELGLSIIAAAREQAVRNQTPKLTFIGARGAGTPNE